MEQSITARHVAELERENAELREQVASIVCRSFRTADKIACLETENAKLRKLVRKMYSVMDMADYVHEFDDPMHLMFVDDMRELGIEVDA